MENYEGGESANYVERNERQSGSAQMREICADLDNVRQVFATNRQQIEQGANQYLPELPADFLNSLQEANQGSGRQSKYFDGGTDVDATANQTQPVLDGGQTPTDARPPLDRPIPPMDATGPSSPVNPNFNSNDLNAVYQRNQQRIDTNHDGFLNSSELDAAALDRSISGEDAQMVAMLRSNQDFFSRFHNDGMLNEPAGISSADMAEFHARQARGRADIARGANNTADARITRAVDADLHSGTERLTRTNGDLFANRANPLQSIVPEACRQGTEGDCVLQAQMASLAHTNPQAIRDMIRENQDGSYTVTFPGDPQNPVRVARPSDTELATYGGGSEHGIWPAVIERAYGTYYSSRNGQVPGEVAANAGESPEVTSRNTELLTGHRGHDEEINRMNEADLRRVLSECNTHPTTAFLNGDRRWPGGRHPETGLPGAHAYSVTGYDPRTGMVTLRNPWGRGEPRGANGGPRDGNDDGTFQMSYEEFRRTFSRVNY